MSAIPGRMLLVSCAMSVCACTVMPTGPSVAVMPAVGKPFEVFAAEERQCRDWASQSSGMSAQEAADRGLTASVVTGTVIGAAVGAAAGGGRGAGAGAAVGAVAGTAAGAGQERVGGYEAQRRYDIAYQQCMYAHGNQLPGSRYAQPAPQYRSPPSTPSYPPPNYPAPPR